MKTYTELPVKEYLASHRGSYQVREPNESQLEEELGHCDERAALLQYEANEMRRYEDEH